MNKAGIVTAEQSISAQLKQLSEDVNRAGDQTDSLRLTQLAKKAERDELNIALCGHFSAGKSTLINTLIDEDVLSAGPIPTSANVVYVRKGRPSAEVVLKSGVTVDVPLAEGDTELGTYLRDGDEVDTVQVTLPLADWPDGVALLDTPGIDSTDEAHRIATESAIHLADVVLYVTDYHHVQSEINFQFTKMLRERGKSVIWVVNQVDKHQPWELSFHDYQAQLVASFRDWQIEPASVYFTSVTEPDSPYNQLPQLISLLRHMVAERETWLQSSLNRSVHDVLRYHREWLREQQQPEREVCEAVIREGGDEADELARIQAELRQVQQAPEQLQRHMEAERATVLRNAPITPYETRELARQYLQACQPGFKVGWLFTAKKTAEETERRLTAFAIDFQKKVEAHIEWHVKDLLVRLAREAGIHDSEFEAEVYALSVPVDPEWLADNAQAGTADRDYVLTYMERLASEIKRRYKHATDPFIEQAVEQKTLAAQAQETALQPQLTRFTSIVQAKEQLASLDDTLDQEVAKLRRHWPMEEAVDDEAADIFDHWIKRLEALLKTEDDPPKIDQPHATANAMALASPAVQSQQASPVMDNRPSSTSKERLERAADMLTHAAMRLNGMGGVEHLVTSMQERADRLRDRTFTVALFGAFSAGKSSFANAMIGDAVLPVSPNPTTAAVNRLVRPQAGCSHGTARIKFKSEADLQADVSDSLAVFRESYRDMPALVRQVAKLRQKKQRVNAKPHLAFLQAVVDGWEAARGELGQERVVDWDTYHAYVSEERKACFVEWIDVYVDCPLTRDGIQLVDTPGADSVNARHTNVAFDYIKNADAIIFVTYYNHAFSQADRSFLEQLGRVKDAFELDKMWFVINAADLAQTPEELDDVRTYVSSQLAARGIREPRLYALSSQTALWAAQASQQQLSPEVERIYRSRLGVEADAPLLSWEDSLSRTGFATFLTDFSRVTVAELTKLAMAGARKDVDRALHVVQRYADAASQDERQRALQLQEAQQRQQAARDHIDQLDEHTEAHALEQEIAELLFYVKQRFFHHLSDRLNEAFHPSVFKEGGNRKALLQTCLHDLFRVFRTELTRELQATALRTEKAVQQSGHHLYDRIVQRLGGEEVTEWLAAYEAAPLAEPSGLTEIIALPADDFVPQLKTFKNEKDFFEGDGKQRMLKAIEQALQAPIDRLMARCEACLSQHYREQLDRAVRHLQQQLQQQVDEYYTGQISILQETGQKAVWDDLAQELLQLLRKSSINPDKEGVKHDAQ